MSVYKFKSENMKNIKNGFLEKIQTDTEFRADIRFSRTIRKSVVAAIAAVAIILSTVVISIAVGFDPMNAWQSLLGRESAIEIGEQVTSAGISMNVQSLYTDGNRALLRLTLKDLEGDRLSGDLRLSSIHYRYWMYIIDSHYIEETSELICIVFIDFYEYYEDVKVGDVFKFTVNSIFVDLSYSQDFNPLDFDLYEAAVNSDLRPVISDEEWAASARENPVDTIYYPEYSVSRGGIYVDSQGMDIVPQKWLPLDTSVQGVELIHWLSVLRVGYVDGYLHIQMRYNDMLGTFWQYSFGDPVLIDNEGGVIRPASAEREEQFIPGEIMYCGYHEQRFYVGDIENLRDLRLAWTGSYAEHTITGDWTVEVDLTSIDEGNISDSVNLSDHHYFTEMSFTLSPMFMDVEMLTMIEFPPDEFFINRDTDQAAMSALGNWRNRLNEIHTAQDLEIILHDGTRIKLDKVGLFDDTHFPMRVTGEGYDPVTGNTTITIWHILDGSFNIDDVKEVIIYGVSFHSK